MKKKSFSFVIVSFFIMIVICISVILRFALSMQGRSEDAISEIGTIYMEGLNRDISRHFQTNVDLRLNQIETIIYNNPPQEMEYGDEMFAQLEAEGKARNFNSLALLSRDGNFESVYGNDMVLENGELFLKSLNNDENRVMMAKDTMGESYILLGVSADYPMMEGEECTALVAGIPIDYFNNILSLGETERGITFSNVIQKNGDYIIGNYDDEEDNFFNRAKSLFSDSDGRDGEDYVKEIKDAIEHDRNYSTVYFLGDERRHLYCSPLPNSDWYLLTIMPYGNIEEVVSTLSSQRTDLMTVCIVVILLCFIVAFLLYYRQTHRQIIELEKARQDAIQANKAKSEFLSNMSHDIRTPMNAIVGMTTIAMESIDGTDSKAQVKYCLKKISQSNKQLLGLINDILDMSKIENGKLALNMELVSLRDLMDDVVTVVQPQIKVKDQEFEIHVHDMLTEEVYSDNVRLNQVLINLLSNAVKFTPEQGKIQVSLYQENSPHGDDYVRTHFIVRDNGIGMSKEFCQKIFESFAREDNKRVQKTEGTGLGMAITKYIVEAMHGTIEVQSEQGHGTKFHVVIDMEKVYAEEKEMQLPPWKILIVDDDQEICKHTVSVLRDFGMDVSWALDGENALLMVEKEHKAGCGYKMILLDWKLPGIDGIETARQIHERIDEDVPQILISAYDWTELEKEAREAGVVGFIAKPLFKSTLYHTLKKFTDGTKNMDAVEEYQQRDFTGVRILLAEDNDLNWEIAYELFSSKGFLLDHAENGKECVNMFSQSEEGYYSFILMDIRMPVMTGYEAAEAIRCLERPDAEQIPIIAMTADAFSEDIKRCLDSGMDAHVAKPIDMREVIAVLEKYI